jgi:hypothetical protein
VEIHRAAERFVQEAEPARQWVLQQRAAQQHAASEWAARF